MGKKREEGISLLEVAVSGALLSVALLSIAFVVFYLLRSSVDNRREYAAHTILMNRLNVVREESTSRSRYLETYGGEGVEFSPPGVSTARVFESADGRVVALPYDSVSDTAVVLRVELKYTDATGAARTDLVESLVRCEQP